VRLSVGRAEAVRQSRARGGTMHEWAARVLCEVDSWGYNAYLPYTTLLVPSCAHMALPPGLCTAQSWLYPSLCAYPFTTSLALYLIGPLLSLGLALRHSPLGWRTLYFFRVVVGCCVPFLGWPFCIAGPPGLI
jgi:hypothetical protein